MTKVALNPDGRVSLNATGRPIIVDVTEYERKCCLWTLSACLGACDDCIDGAPHFYTVSFSDAGDMPGDDGVCYNLPNGNDSYRFRNGDAPFPSINGSHVLKRYGLLDGGCYWERRDTFSFIDIKLQGMEGYTDCSAQNCIFSSCPYLRTIGFRHGPGTLWGFDLWVIWTHPSGYGPLLQTFGTAGFTSSRPGGGWANVGDPRCLEVNKEISSGMGDPDMCCGYCATWIHYNLGGLATINPGGVGTRCPGDEPIYTTTDLSEHENNVVLLNDNVCYTVSKTPFNECPADELIVGAVTVIQNYGSNCVACCDG